MLPRSHFDRLVPVVLNVIMAEETPSTTSVKKHGMRMRMGSDAQKKYQGGERVSIKDVKDLGLDIMDKLANVKQSMGDIAQPNERYRIGFITNKAIGAGFALIGALETGTSKSNEIPTADNKRLSTSARRKSKARRKSLQLGTRNYFIVDAGAEVNN